MSHLQLHTSSKILNNNQSSNDLFSAEFYQQLIEDLQDEALAWRISYELGGERIYVPKNIKPNSVWYKFGDAFCNWLSLNYGGEQIIIPLGPASLLKKRNIQAITMLERGFSTNQIVKTLGYSYRNIQYKKAKYKNHQQLKLFEPEKNHQL